MSAKRCTSCGNASDPRAVSCWVCGGTLAPIADLPAPAEEPDKWHFVGWLLLLGGLSFVSLLVGVELALEWPGLLIPYAVVMVVVYGAIGRTAYVQLSAPKKPADQGAGAAAPSGGGDAPSGKVTASEVITGVALAASAIAVVLGLLLLLAVSAVVIFMMVCFAVLAVGMH